MEALVSALVSEIVKHTVRQFRLLMPGPDLISDIFKEELERPQRGTEFTGAYLMMAKMTMETAITAFRRAKVVATLRLTSPEAVLISVMFEEKLVDTESMMTSAYALFKDMDIDYEQQVQSGGAFDTLLTAIVHIAYDVEDNLQKHFPFLGSKQRRKQRCLPVAILVSGLSHGALDARLFGQALAGIRKRLHNLGALQDHLGLNTSVDGLVGTSSIHHGEGGDVWRMRSYFLHDLDVEETEVVGFEEHITTIVHKLLDPDMHHATISIVGMAGLGKTILAKKAYKTVEHQFDCSAMVYVSQRPSIDELLQDLAEQVGLEQQQPEDLEVNLCKYLESKRYVIFLDDIWNSQAWDSLRVAIPNNSSKFGSRIIITSRKIQVGRIGGDSSLYELQPLDEKNSWNLFANKAVELLKTRGNKMESIARKIVGRCGGVPLAIEDVVRMLQSSEANEDEWQRVLESKGQRYDQCSRVLALSFQDLASPLMSCLLYFGLFPEGYEFSASDVIDQWINERLVKVEGSLEGEEVGNGYLNNLVDGNLIQVSTRRVDGKIRNFRLHDIVHSFCIWMATNTDFFNTHEASIHQTGARRLTIPSLAELNGQPATLRTLVCTNDAVSAEADELFKRFRLLRVLIVGSNQLASCLTKGLGNLTLLRHLASIGKSWPPRRAKLSSTIAKLKWLATLDLRNVECETIPKEVWLMFHLRHILFRKPSLLGTMPMNDMKNAKHGPTNIEVFLPNLQTLYVVPGQLLPAKLLQGPTGELRKLGIFCPTDKALEQLANFKIPFRLETLWLSCAPKTKFNLCRFDRLQRLHLKIDTLPKRPNLPRNIVKLVLVLYDMKEDPMEVLKGLCELEILKLYVDKCNTNEMVCSGGPEAFPELKVLQLYLPFYVRKLTVEEDAMPKLKKVSGLSRRVLLQVPERIRASCVNRIH